MKNRISSLRYSLRPRFLASRLDVQDQQKHCGNKHKQNAGYKTQFVSFHESLPTPKHYSAYGL